MVSCKEKEVIYNIGDEVTIDGIKYKLYSTNELGYNRENKHAGYFNPDGTLKKLMKKIFIKSMMIGLVFYINFIIMIC